MGVPKIFTVGYGNRKFDDFVELLKRFSIELIIDVRRFPTSKWPEFVKENLQRTLPTKGVGYVHIRELGGYRGGYGVYTRTHELASVEGTNETRAREALINHVRRIQPERMPSSLHNKGAEKAKMEGRAHSR